MNKEYDARDLMKALRISAARVYDKLHHKKPKPNAKLMILKQSLSELEKKHKEISNKLHPKYIELGKKILQLKRVIKELENQ